MIFSFYAQYNDLFGLNITSNHKKKVTYDMKSLLKL